MIQVHRGLSFAASALCPYCKCRLEDLEQVIDCTYCETLHHAACWKENGSHCSVFSCQGTVWPRSKGFRWIRSGVLIHGALNVLVNFFIQSARPIVEWFSVPDALALLLLQGTLLLTGIAVLSKFHPSSEEDVRNSSIKSIAALVLSSNALFIALLLLYLLREGWQNLVALIAF